MKTVPLGEVAQVVSGATPKTNVTEYWGGDIPWATPADLSRTDGAYISVTPRTLTESGYRSCPTVLLPAGSVLLSSRAPIGHVAINSVPMATNQGFKSLVPGPDLEAKFLYHWLKANRSSLEALGNGATFKEISKRTTERIQIPLPPLEEQRRIAAILDTADAIRAKRRQVLAHLDSLAQSIFHEMFVGKGWPLRPIASLGSIATGKTPPTAREGMFDGPIPFVTPGDLESSRPVARSLTDAGAGESRTVREGSTLVCCIGATIGKVGVARERSAFNQQINAVEWGDELEDLYGLEAMKLLKPQIIGQGSSTTLPLLPKSRFSQLAIGVPPLVMQKAFASRAKEIQVIREVRVRSLQAVDELFASLQSQAFRGEL